MRRSLLAVPFLALFVAAVFPHRGSDSEPRWWKGNTHTHTLWSDGDAAPELVTRWYVEHDYDFLVLSDHNVMQEGERWFPVSDGSSRRLPPEQVELLSTVFGEEAVELRSGTEQDELLLRGLAELRKRFEEPGEFLLVAGEEVTGAFRQAEPEQRNFPVHVNMVNLASLVMPPDGSSPVDTMNAILAAIHAQARADGRPVVAHVNHPNFGWGLSWEDLAAMRHDRFFEVHNGHRGVNNAGDAEHPGTEEMWDRANARRVSETGLELLYGVATDDAHDVYGGGATSRPGRGWVMVRASELSGDALVEAMRRGDFYSSSGVTLADVRFASRVLEVEIEVEEGVSYTTRFVGCRTGGEPGEVLAETTENPAVYRLRPEDLFVRAKITSSRLHPDGTRDGELESAWTQPVR